jgi:homoserine dehydrogenase
MHAWRAIRTAAALFGSGTVGQALSRATGVARWGIALPPLRLSPIPRNARRATIRREPWRAWPHAAREQAVTPDLDALSGGDVVVDATASDDVACAALRMAGARPAMWSPLNKLGGGASLRRARAIRRGRALRRAHALRRQRDRWCRPAAVCGSIRELVAGGDRIHVIEGVLSGSLAWLFDRFDGMRPFSGFVREARAAGYTEPDPRIDLGGEDVRRKLLLLARAAGAPLESERVSVESLLPRALAEAGESEIERRFPIWMRHCVGATAGVSRWRRPAFHRPFEVDAQRGLACQRRAPRIAEVASAVRR